MQAATDGAPDWASVAASERASALCAAAARLRERRLELAALEVRECAKPWPEADADVCEAIDFLEYYARQALELDDGRELVQAPGEHNRLHYVPRGVAAVISPWNFPLAIPAGLTAAALATGNAVVLKPAEQSPACATELVSALHAGGVPARALALVPGEGDAGAALVRHPDVSTIGFTGSAAVGLEIVRAAGATAPGQRHIKRVIAELGGKNCVLVASDADLDEAVPAIVASAFAYAGQKCSAASRVLAHEAIAGELSRAPGRRGAGADRGPGRRRGHAGAAADRARGSGAGAGLHGDGEARRHCPGRPRRRAGQGVVLRAGAGGGPGAESPLLSDEVFGPLLSVEAVSGLDQACEIVHSLAVGLTAGVFSRDPHAVAEMAARLPVGNLYVNRAITGAKVGRQPFGGNRLSGSGLKAGGPDYLLGFVDSRVVTENVVRHGLAL